MEIRKFILRFVLFSVILASVYFFALWQVAQGQVDYFYPKFTHRAGSMIVGISRANDGISPAVIEQNFSNNDIAYPVLNFAFANQVSDYGSVYLNALQKKINPETKNGLFILEVTPGSLSILKSKTDSIPSLSDEPSFLSTINHLNSSPNYEYIRKRYNHSLYKGFKRSRRIDEIRYSHPDGWLEVMKKSEFYEVSEEEVQSWTNSNIEDAKYKVDFYKPSEARLFYLEKTIRYLKEHGQVFLVRIPICAELLKIEQSFWPGFNTRMEELASENQVVYFDYSKDGAKYDSYDGSHLFGESAKVFTQQLCDDIHLYVAE